MQNIFGQLRFVFSYLFSKFSKLCSRLTNRIQVSFWILLKVWLHKLDLSRIIFEEFVKFIKNLSKNQIPSVAYSNSKHTLWMMLGIEFFTRRFFLFIPVFNFYLTKPVKNVRKHWYKCHFFGWLYFFEK